MQKEVDARGMQCPLPVIEVKKALEEITESGTIKVIVDNEIAAQNVMKLAKQKNITANDECISKDEYWVHLEVGNVENLKKQKQKTDEVDDIMQCEPKKKKKVVVISSCCMGNGDDALGKTLMKGFIFALTKQDVLPDTIIFYNSGVTLVSEGSESLEDLKELEEEGVELFACGTCLDCFKLTEKRKIGSVTNMYSIAEMMLNAGLLIKP